ncbi:MAG: AAA family ATPase [Actinobacteria bacterium]|nr:AAA family ATPase [Actinomycetota bacterium]
MSTRAQEDELRPVTVLFADVVGSTGLGEKLSPDEVKALVGECVTMMSRAVEEYGGMVQAYAGDGICAYFGVPAAHDDDPERAARAGLRILEVVDEYAREVEAAWGLAGFAVRVGLNGGQAAVGQVGAAEPGAVALGDATNVAARLQSLAEPGAILAGEATVRRLAQRFVFEPAGEFEVKGRKAPVSASRLVGPRAREPVAGATPVVGRDEEMAQLMGALGDLVAGRGRVVLLLGDPGIGKTRLLTELRGLAGDRVAWLEGHCLSYGGVTTWPFVDALLGWLGAEIGEPEIAVRTKARARLGALFGDRLDDVLLPLGRLLRLRVDASAESISPDRIREAYIRWLEALAAERPVVLALEDVHWADAPTRELAEAVLDLAERAPLALFLTEEVAPRSEGAALRLRALGDHGHRTTAIPLGPLPDEAAEQMLAGILESEVDVVTRTGLIREAEGNPLYLEELARALLEGGLQPRGRTWTVTVRADLLPPALENLLVARIDRLPTEARQLAPLAAAIGRTFPVPVLEAVAGAEVGESLEALLRAEIVREVRRYPVFECSFTHGLLHDAALSTLTPTRKRDLYARIATAFESLYAESLDDYLERLAHYHAQAGNLPKAFEYAERARSISPRLDTRRAGQ